MGSEYRFKIGDFPINVLLYPTDTIASIREIIFNKLESQAYKFSVNQDSTYIKFCFRGQDCGLPAYKTLQEWYDFCEDQYKLQSINEFTFECSVSDKSHDSAPISPTPAPINTTSILPLSLKCFSGFCIGIIVYRASTMIHKASTNNVISYGSYNCLKNTLTAGCAGAIIGYVGSKAVDTLYYK